VSTLDHDIVRGSIARPEGNHRENLVRARPEDTGRCPPLRPEDTGQRPPLRPQEDDMERFDGTIVDPGPGRSQGKGGTDRLRGFQGRRTQSDTLFFHAKTIVS